MTNPQTPMPPRRSLRLLAKSAKRILGGILILVILLVAILFYCIQSENGSALLWRVTEKIVPGTLSGTYVSGTIANGVHLRNLKYTNQKNQIDIDDIDGQWQLAFSPLILSIDHMRIGTVNVHMSDAPTTKKGLPQNLRLPLALNIKLLTMTELNLHQGLSTSILHALNLHGESTSVQHTIILEHVATAYGNIGATLHMEGTKPFALNGTATIEGTVKEEPYSLHLKLDGTLEKLAIAVQASGNRLSGQALIKAMPFAAVPFERLELDAAHLNPKAFNANAPNADLTLHAALTPDPQTAQHDAFPSVSGSISINNTQAGAIDADKLPLESVSTLVHFDDRHVKLTQLQIRIPGNATLEGAGELQQTRDNKSIGELQVSVNTLDLHALYGKLQSTKFTGPLQVKLLPDNQQITLKLNDPRLSIALDAQIEPTRVTLRSAQLEAGTARVNVTGSMTRDTQLAYTLQGKLTQFDPALWINGTSENTPGKLQRNKSGQKEAQSGNKKIGEIHGHINMDFNAEGRLVPTLQAMLKFNLHDSEYGNLPLTGSGQLAVSGKHLLPSKVQLSIAGNDLSLLGSLGGTDDHLKIRLNAPQLDRLGFGLSGLLDLDAEIIGTMARPDLHATYRAERLVFGEHHLGGMLGQADIRGDLTDNPHALNNSNLSVKLDVHDYAAPGIKLDHAQAAISGTYNNHSMNLNAAGKVHDKPLDFTLAAQGRLMQSTDGLHWDGSINKLEDRGFLQLAAATPFTISASSQRFVMGAAKFSLFDTAFDMKNFSYDHGSIASEGNTGDIHLKKILALQQEFGDTPSQIKTDLICDARWRFSTLGNVDGYIDINRRSGDITVDPGRGDIALGLSDLHLHTTLHARQITLEARAAATRIGSMALQAQSTLKADLGTDQPLTAKLAIDIPNLKTVGALLGPRYAIDGSINATLSSTGTLIEPTLSGTVNGDKLSFTLYDQGIQLHDGIAHLTLDKNVVTLQKLEFHSGNGVLKADGQVQVGQSNPDLHARIVADHLQLFASPDRELTLSGQANLASMNGQLRIDGKVAVNHALFDFPKSSAPRLGDDVVIVHHGGKVERAVAANDQDKMAKSSEKPAGRFAPVVDLNLDLGEDFRFRGSGADIKLDGNLMIHSEPYQPMKTTGTIQVVSGTYEAFGRKLAIEHGVLNFQGALDNPNIDILAMRRNQDVEAGVEISGLARKPRTKLVSEPDVADEEKLSWLMFGHGSESNGLGQQQAASAALGLLGSVGGKSVAKGIGLDTFSIGASESGLNDQQVVNIGKAISEKFVVGYEQSLSGAASIAKLTWQISHRWSLVLRAGAINGLDVLFSLRYD